jgi:hypothetical protein
MSNIDFRSRCLGLLVLLTAALGLAAWRLPRYRQAQFLALLSPLVEERRVALFGPLLPGGIEGLMEGPLQDGRFKEAVWAYPGLIARFRSLHPEIKNDFRDSLVALMGMELSYMNSAIQFRNARDSAASLAAKSCLVNGIFSQDALLDSFSQDTLLDSVDDKRGQQKTDQQDRDKEFTVTGRELQDVKLKLTDAAADFRYKALLLLAQDVEVLAPDRPSIRFELLTLPDLSPVKGAEDWAKNPEKNCKAASSDPLLDSSSPYRRIYSIETRLPCFCGNDDR